MSAIRRGTVSETQRKRFLQERMLLVHGILAICLLVIVSRLIELQVLRGSEYRALAQSQHFGGVVLKAKRGDILSTNSKSGDASILATNTTLNMVYVDPVITDNPTFVAETLSDALVTEEYDALCRSGDRSCPQELIEYYRIAFDPLERIVDIDTGAFLEPVSISDLPFDEEALPDHTEVRRQFARNIERRISEKSVTYVPLVYGATKLQMRAVQDLFIPGITVSVDKRLIYGNPEEISQIRLPLIASQLSDPLEKDPLTIRRLLRQRPLRYVSVMRRLPPSLSTTLKDILQESARETNKRRSEAPTNEAAGHILDPLRSIAILPEHWRYYPDGNIASHVVGFLNTNDEAQYGIERTYNPQLKGQEGRITAVSDLHGGQIVTDEQTVIDPQDGDTIVLTIDRFIQQEVESIMQEALEEYDADSGQAIVMDPKTGRILAMVNVPLFDSNTYGDVFEKEPVYLSERKQKEVVVEIYHPDTKQFVIKAYREDVFTIDGRLRLTPETQETLNEIEELYELEDIARYYLYIGENSRRELFETDREDIWLKYKNNIGVGAYLNRTIQEIYEPGSVLKPITMAIALDQGEITPSDLYLDEGPVEVDEYKIKNSLDKYYDEVTMTNCLEFSINTCMTHVSQKLGRKLFYRMLIRFGFGSITGIQLEDELSGEINHWKKWSQSELATASFGQGISSTPLQVITALSAIANNGKLMSPTIIRSIRHSDGTIETIEPHMIDQVIRPETAETVTAMMVSAVSNGFAKTAKVKGYRIAGKTGTSQIAGPGGKYETGTGSSITSFAGFAPIDSPRFSMIVKFDRPREAEFGAESAAPVFKKVAGFLFKYYGIPPDET